MSDDRPQYGEYATPEQQRAAAGLPPVEPETQTPAVPSAPAGAAASAPAASASAPSQAKPASRMDRIITAALLGVGLVNVLGSIPGFLDLSSTMDRTLQVMGLDGEFTNFAAARVWGPTAAVVMLAGYVVTAWLGFRRVRRGRIAWWVPLLGFVITMAIVSVCISVPMLGDPAFTQGLPSAPAG